MYSSIDQAMSKVESQAKRLKEKIKDKKRQDEKASIEFEEAAAPVDSPRVIESEAFAVKPLMIDDAVQELQGSPGIFIAFRNAKTNEVNVLFKRGDGHFGLIQPH
jgi:putative sigma-54 modulation protein